jgi:hypothetical protein
VISKRMVYDCVACGKCLFKNLSEISNSVACNECGRFWCERCAIREGLTVFEESPGCRRVEGCKCTEEKEVERQKARQKEREELCLDRRWSI